MFLPADSRQWWLNGLMFDSNRTGFVPWGGGQSLRALLARTMGSVAAAQPTWLVAAVLVGAVGIACAAVLDLAGHQMAGILTCALTGLLVSRLPGITTGCGSPRAWPRRPTTRSRPCAQAHGTWWRRAARWPAIGFWAPAAGMVAVYGAWPDSLFGLPGAASHFAFGLIWDSAEQPDPGLCDPQRALVE